MQNEKVPGQNGYLYLFWKIFTYLAMGKVFGHCYMKNPETAKNLIGEGMLIRVVGTAGRVAGAKNVFLSKIGTQTFYW